MKQVKQSLWLIIAAMPYLASTLWAQSATTREPARSPDVPYVPTRQEVVDGMLRLAKVKSGDVVYDLGCGDGRIVITAVKQFGAARGVGIDIDPQRIVEANENARAAGVGAKVKFIEGDLFDANFREASVVTLYLLPSINLKLKPKLLAELKPGTRVVSHDFNMGDDWPPEETVRIGASTVYFWTIPARTADQKTTKSTS